MQWPHLVRITEVFLELLRDETMPPLRRLLVCSALADSLRPLFLSALDATSLEKVIATYRHLALSAVEKDTLCRTQPKGVIRAGFRQLLAIYAQQDRYNERRKLLPRFATYLSLLTGQGIVPVLRADFPTTTFRAVDAPTGPLPDESWEPLLRCLRVRLQGLSFFGERFYGYPYLDGLAALLLTVPLSLWFARVYATGQGRSTLDAACVARGVAIVHLAHGITPALTLPAQRERFSLLTTHAALRDLLMWYGE